MYNTAFSIIFNSQPLSLQKQPAPRQRKIYYMATPKPWRYAALAATTLLALTACNKSENSEEAQKAAAAAKAAQCDSFIEKLPQGYDTEIGENGYTLSGGERQRLSIARALLKDAPIILLDEATAALDPENETLIQHAIGTLIKGKTVIVIAHRLRTVENADKIIVLNKGTIAETGTHAELMEKDGIYREMYRLQRESESWSA